MNSKIFSALAHFFRLIAETYKKSEINTAIVLIFNIFSSAWKRSRIVSFLRGSNEFDNRLKKTRIYRIVGFPARIFSVFQRTLGPKLLYQRKNSILIEFAYAAMSNALSLNTRVYGALFAAFCLGRAGVRMWHGQYVLPLLFAGIAISVVIMFFNFNMMSAFSSSKVITFIKSAVGFDNVRFDFYDEKPVGKPAFVGLFAALGLVSGILSVKYLLISVALPIAFIGILLVIFFPVVGVFAAVLSAAFIPTMVLAGICLLTGASFIVHAIANKNFEWKFGGVWTGLALFLIFLFVSSVFSFSRMKSLTVCAMYFVFVGFYIIVVNVIRTKTQLYSLVKGFVLVGALISLYGILQYIFGWTTDNSWIDTDMFEDATLRVYSTLDNPNVLGEYLLFILPLSVVVMLKSREKSLSKLLYFLIFAESLVCMLLTQSRGCWLGLILAACVFITFYNGKIWVLIPVALALLPFVIPDTMINRLMSIGNMSDSSTSYRVFIWMGVLRLLSDFWVGGIGMGEGAFSLIYPFYSYNGVYAAHSHNTYLQLLVEGGVGTLIIFIATMICLLCNLAKTFRKFTKRSTESLLSLALGSAFIGFLLQSMFDYTFYNYRMMAMFFMMAAVGMTIRHVGGDSNN